MSGVISTWWNYFYHDIMKDDIQRYQTLIAALAAIFVGLVDWHLDCSFNKFCSRIQARKQEN